MLFHYILLPLTITLASAETSLDSRSPRTLRHPLTTLLVPFRPPSTTDAVPLCFIISSLRTEGIHSRNSLLRGLFCCNRCSRHSLVSLLPSFPSVSSFVFDRVRQIHRSRTSQRGVLTLQIFIPTFPYSYVNYK